MKKSSNSDRDRDMLEDYDFSKGVRGKYAKRFGQRSRAIVLDSDVAEVSIDAKSANEALRALANVIRQQSKRASS